MSERPHISPERWRTKFSGDIPLVTRAPAGTAEVVAALGRGEFTESVAAERLVALGLDVAFAASIARANAPKSGHMNSDRQSPGSEVPE